MPNFPLEPGRDYGAAVASLQERVFRRGIRYDLSAFDALLSALGRPEQSLPPTVHIAGTNGKGSTLAFLSQLLQAAGLKVMRYSSPHLFQYTERFLLDETAIPVSDFVGYVDQVTACDEMISANLTEFELLTAMVFLWAAALKPDVLLLETGLGGRLDASNVVQADVALLSRIDRDHEAILGSELTQIAGEKAGIMKPHQLVLSVPQHQDVSPVLSKYAEKVRARLHMISPQTMFARTDHLPPYQQENVALACHAYTALRHNCFNDLPASPSPRLQGPPGRFTHVQVNGQDIVIDVAHNPHGLSTLIKSLRHVFPVQPYSFIFSANTNKNVSDMASLLESASSSLYYVDGVDSCLDFKTFSRYIRAPWICLQKGQVPVFSGVLVITGTFRLMAAYKVYFKDSDES